ncbi:hypothetical protein T12_6528 [Trichinella patagoniensis]|uniref:Uncharacterized protein n=1 Tax=Trichinella patagoniensis TaxID=990121 RepID=A0A0V0YQT5_9BILA|nr:hypothetical protein T12_6528 [Trichinella patagoniensis]
MHIISSYAKPADLMNYTSKVIVSKQRCSSICQSL